jgi:hypothetical protein
MLIAAGSTDTILVEHLVLPFAPLALVAAGVVVAGALARDRRVAGLLWSQLAIACVVLSTMFSIGYSKTNLDLMAKYIAAESAEDDLVILIPGFFGGAFNRSFEVARSQINFPVMGPDSLYLFDHQVQRILAPAALSMALDSISNAAVGGRSIWLILPTTWVDGAKPALDADEAVSGQAAAFQNRATALRNRLFEAYGRPEARMSVFHRSWSMEALTLEHFPNSNGGGS